MASTATAVAQGTDAVTNGVDDPDARELRAMLLDPRWLPADLDVEQGTVSMLRVDEQTVGRSTFIDQRIEMPATPVRPVSIHAVAEAGIAEPRPAWLWHTSFCCSTLLARMLHVPPLQVSLKEPLLLRRLGDARLAAIDIQRHFDPAVRLLSRPWHRDGTVIIKPTHAALNVAAELMEATPASRATVITSTLRDFIVSNLKKTPETQSRIPLLADRALRAGSYRHRLPPAAFEPPDMPCCAALQWAAQQELLDEIEQRIGPSRLQWIQEADLLGAMSRTVRSVADWLELPVPWPLLERHVLQTSRRNAKALEFDYGPQAKADEARFVIGLAPGRIDAAVEWAECHLRPAMRSRQAGVESTWWSGRR